MKKIHILLIIILCIVFYLIFSGRLFINFAHGNPIAEIIISGGWPNDERIYMTRIYENGTKVDYYENGKRRLHEKLTNDSMQRLQEKIDLVIENKALLEIWPETVGGCRQDIDVPDIIYQLYASDQKTKITFGSCYHESEYPEKQDASQYGWLVNEIYELID